MAKCENCKHDIARHDRTGCHTIVVRNEYEAWECRCSWPCGKRPSGETIVTDKKTRKPEEEDDNR